VYDENLPSGEMSVTGGLHPQRVFCLDSSTGIVKWKTRVAGDNVSFARGKSIVGTNGAVWIGSGMTNSAPHLPIQFLDANNQTAFSANIDTNFYAIIKYNRYGDVVGAVAFESFNGQFLISDRSNTAVVGGFVSAYATVNAFDSVTGQRQELFSYRLASSLAFKVEIANDTAFMAPILTTPSITTPTTPSATTKMKTTQTRKITSKMQVSTYLLANSRIQLSSVQSDTIVPTATLPYPPPTGSAPLASSVILILAGVGALVASFVMCFIFYWLSIRAKRQGTKVSLNSSDRLSTNFSAAMAQTKWTTSSRLQSSPMTDISDRTASDFVTGTRFSTV
jgi:hypothetical protein